MRDIIWTIIVTWIIWKVYEAFKGISKTKLQTQNSYKNQTNRYNSRKEGEIKVEKASKQKSHFKPGYGEYVDYEEVK